MTTTKLDELDHGYAWIILILNHGYAWIILGGKNIIQNDNYKTR